MAIQKLFSKILLIQTYHTTCASFSCEFIFGISVVLLYHIYLGIRYICIKRGKYISFKLYVYTKLHLQFTTVYDCALNTLNTISVLFTG